MSVGTYSLQLTQSDSLKGFSQSEIYQKRATEKNIFFLKICMLWGLNSFIKNDFAMFIMAIIFESFCCNAFKFSAFSRCQIKWGICCYDYEAFIWRVAQISFFFFLSRGEFRKRIYLYLLSHSSDIGWLQILLYM